MAKRDIQPYLADGETVEASWDGIITNHVSSGSVDNLDELEQELQRAEGDDYGYTFAATDRRLMYLTDAREFKDISYEHIKSVETSETEKTPTSAKWDGVSAAIGVLALLGGFSNLFTGGPIAGPLLMMGIGGLLIGIAAIGDNDHETTTVQKVTVNTGQQEEDLKFETPEDVGAILSRSIRG